MDTTEMDRVDHDVTPEYEPIPSRSQSFKRRKINSYQKVLETFTKEWKDSQEEMLRKLLENDEKLIDYKMKKQKDMMAELMKNNRKAIKEMLDEDRQETSKMLQHFLNNLQHVHPYMYHPPPFYANTNAPVPEVSPPDNNNEY